jgi:hypothetical protein
MKTLKITFAAFLIAAASFTASANNNTNANEKYTMKFAVTSYVDAFSLGKLDHIEDILDADAKMTTTNGDRIKTYSRDEIVALLKPTDGIKQNCETSYSVVESLPSQVIVKVNMLYPSFRKVNYVTMVQSNEGWKITNISSVFQAKS